jgi:hypothetical protein
VKRTASLIAGLSLIACLAARADEPAFGNSVNGSASAFSLSTYGQLSLSGGAVSFTPEANIDLTSVSLWLSGYTGQYGQSIDVSLWDSNPANTGFANTGNAGSFPWSPVITLQSAAANNGSLGEFTFDASSSMVLSANTEYWLVVTAGGHAGNNMTGASWIEGGTLAGNATYDGAESYNVYGGAFDTSSALPSFSINTDTDSLTAVTAAPEPSSMALMIIPFLLLVGRMFYNRHNAKKLALARAQRPVKIIRR